MVSKAHIDELFELPFNELLYQAQATHRQYHNNNEMELCTLLSVKTGACPEDCKYCPQSGRYDTGLEKEKLMDVETVVEYAKNAKRSGAKRFCMGAAWRNPPAKHFPRIVEMVKRVRQLGLETCMTLGMLSDDQAKQLKEAGLDYYNHNLDTSPEYYPEVASTRTYQDRLDTLERVRQSGINVCCGGIIGLGETRQDRVSFLHQLANFQKPPASVPINELIPVPGTPFQDNTKVDTFEFVRTIAVARIIMPYSKVRLSAGRTGMNEQTQALCYMAGANSIFYGEKLLTADNPERDRDLDLLNRLGMTAQTEMETENTESYYDERAISDETP
jgi:biotin synthase